MLNYDRCKRNILFKFSFFTETQLLDDLILLLEWNRQSSQKDQRQYWTKSKYRQGRSNSRWEGRGPWWKRSAIGQESQEEVGRRLTPEAGIPAKRAAL